MPFHWKYLLPFLLTTILSSGHSIAQENNYEGLWKGLLSQHDRAVMYEVVLKLYYESDSTLFGTSKIVHKNGNYSEFYVEGTYKDNQLVFKDQILIKETGSSHQFHWCVKKYFAQLTGSNDKWTLEGNWENDGTTYSLGKFHEGKFNCQPGKFSLTKVKGATIFKPGVDDKVRYFQGRYVEVQQIVEIDADSLELNFIDNNQIDNDTITIFFNKDLMKKQHHLSHDTLKVMVKILPKTENLLIVYANNVGTMPPNTAALIYFENGVKKEISLKSDRSKNAGIIFRKKED
jgi:hypothetical protein